MVVPATFPFPDERCQELASRRGLVLNMHHILVLGLNTSRWPEDVPFSFKKNPEIMEGYWRQCMEAFKDYETLWTVGYRGKADNAFWWNEEGYKTPEARGELISSAIAKQVEIVREKHPDAEFISNLWQEGAGLYLDGDIKLPEGVIPVWPDAGDGIIQDNGRVSAGQGVYFHTAMMSWHSNQLTENVHPARIYRELGRFIEAGATEYLLINVSDIRAVPLTTDCVMRLAWESKPYKGKTDQENMDDFLLDWSTRQFGADAAQDVADVYSKYFGIPYKEVSVDVGNKHIVLIGEQHLATEMNNLTGRIRSVLDKGESLNEELLNQCNKWLDFCRKDFPYLSDLNRMAESVCYKIPDDRKDFYQAHVLTQIQTHLHLLSMSISYCEGMIALNEDNREEAIEKVEKALQSNIDVHDALTKAEYGKWKDWYMGQGFVTINHSYDYLRVLLAQLRNEPLPPVVRSRNKEQYGNILKYQKRFPENFPLFYPEN